jgi:hypothetical protein
MKVPLFNSFVLPSTVYICFLIWTRIRNPRVTDAEADPAKVPDPCGAGTTTLLDHDPQLNEKSDHDQ